MIQRVHIASRQAKELRPAEAARIKRVALYQKMKAIAEDPDAPGDTRRKAEEACLDVRARIDRYDAETLNPVSARHDELVEKRKRLKSDLDRLASARDAANRAVESVCSEKEKRTHRLTNFVSLSASTHDCPKFGESAQLVKIIVGLTGSIRPFRPCQAHNDLQCAGSRQRMGGALKVSPGIDGAHRVV